MDIKNLSYYQLKTAMNLINGSLFWPGPEAPYLDHYYPGPLMSFLLTPPLLLSSTPYFSVLIWVLIWLSLTYAIAVLFVKSICRDPFSLFLFFLLLLTSPFLSNSILNLEWNRIFSLLFHLLILIFTYRWSQTRNEAYLIPIGFTIGLGVQLDYSILFHLITLLCFFITDEKALNSFQESQFKNNEDETKAFQWKYALACVTLILLPQIPCLLAYGNNKIDLPKFNWYQMHWFIQDFLSDPFDRLENIAENIDFNRERLLQISPFLTLLFYRFLFRKNKTQSNESLIHLTLISTGPLFMILISHNGFYFLNLGFLLLISKYHDQLLPKNPALKALYFCFYGFSLTMSFSFKFLIFLHFIFLSGIFFLRFNTSFEYFRRSWFKKFSLGEIPAKKIQTTAGITNLMFFNLNLLFSVFLAYHLLTLSKHSYQSKSSQLKHLMSYIEEETGWKEQAALSRIFTIGFKNKNRSMAFPYLLAQEENKRTAGKYKKQREKTSTPSHFSLHSPHSHDSSKEHTLTNLTITPAHKKKHKIQAIDAAHSLEEKLNTESSETNSKELGYFIIEKNADYRYENIKSFLLQTTLPYEIKKEIKENKLKIKASSYQETKRYALIPYLITKKSQFPFGFHNVSTTHPNDQSDWFEENCYFNVLYKRKDSIYLCYIMDGRLEFIGVKLNFLKEKNQNFLIAEINSPPLSIIKGNRVIPHSFLMNLNVHFHCQKEEALSIIDRIGLSNDKKEFDKSFFAPLIIKKPLLCDLKSLQKISISFSHNRRYEAKLEKLFELKL